MRPLCLLSEIWNRLQKTYREANDYELLRSEPNVQEVSFFQRKSREWQNWVPRNISSFAIWRHGGRVHGNKVVLCRKQYTNFAFMTVLFGMWLNFIFHISKFVSNFLNFTNNTLHSMWKHCTWLQEYKDEQDTFSDLKGLTVLHSQSFHDPWIPVHFLRVRIRILNSQTACSFISQIF